MFETKSVNDGFLDKIVTVNKQISELINFPDLTQKERNYLYNTAADKCQAGDFIGAISLFQFLVLAERSNKLYIKGLAGAMHGAKRYHEALDLYQMVYMIDAEVEYDCLFYIADCMLNIGEYLTAQANLEQFIELCIHLNLQNSFIFKRANLLLAGIPK